MGGSHYGCVIWKEGGRLGSIYIKNVWSFVLSGHNTQVERENGSIWSGEKKTHSRIYITAQIWATYHAKLEADWHYCMGEKVYKDTKQESQKNIKIPTPDSAAFYCSVAHLSLSHNICALCNSTVHCAKGACCRSEINTNTSCVYIIYTDCRLYASALSKNDLVEHCTTAPLS